MSEDYAKVLEILGLTQAQLDAAKAKCANYLPSPEVSIAPSDIEGVGAFVKFPCSAASTVAVGMKDNRWTAAGRFTNHASQPNVKAVKRAGQVEFVSLKPLRVGDELTVDYLQVKAALQERPNYG